MKRWHGYALEGDLGAHATDWDQLNRSTFGHHPLLDSRFWNGLLRSFGHGGIRLWVLRRRDTVLAMCLLEQRGWGHWESFLPAQAQVGPVMIPDTALVDSLLLALRPRAIQLDLLCIDPAICRLQPSPDRAARLTPHALTMNVATQGGHAAYWERRSAGLRQNQRRYERLARKDGLQLVLRVTRDAAEMPAAVRRYAALESAGWKGIAGSALAPGNEQARFYSGTLAAFAATGQAAVHELWDGERLVASRLMVESNGTLVMLKTTYDESLARYAVGWQLLSQSLQQAFADPAVHHVEFYTNASTAQLAWAGGTRWIQHVSYLRQSRLGSLWNVAQALRRRFVARDPAAAAGLVVERLPMDQPWPADVQALFDASGRQSPECSAAWFANLHRTVFAGHPEAALWVLRQDGQAVAALPLLVSADHLGRQLASLSNYYTAFFTPAVADGLRADALAMLLRHLVAHYRDLGRITFEPMDPHGAGFHLLVRALELAGLVCFKYFRFGNWHLKAPGSWDAYLAGRSANQRSAIRRSSRKLADAGGRVEIITAPADLARGRAAYWQVYGASWKNDEPHPEFIDGLMQWAADAGQLRLGVAWLQGRPVAVQLWLVAHGRAEIYKLAYDEACKRLAPGNALTAALLRHVMERDAVQEVDYLIGDDAYKQTWMSDRRERWGIQAHHPLRAGGIAGLLQHAGGSVLRGLRQQLRPRRADQ